MADRIRSGGADSSSATVASGRFAPSTTGPAHPGTLLAGLLCWLDARVSGDRVVLRLEDLDPDRCEPEWTRAMIDDLGWLGLDWDAVFHQSDAASLHERALDRLAAAGRLYPCACSRATLRAHGERAPNGGWRYPNRCRDRALPASGWRACIEPLRVRLPDGPVRWPDASGRDVDSDPGRELGDPVVRRRDGALAYLLASVVDDAECGVTRVVRGHDLAATTATQVCLQQLLALPTPSYRHHLLLLEERGGKLAKLHGAVATPDLRPRYGAAELCGFLAHAAGLSSDARPTTPRALLADFRWSNVGTRDRVVRWDGSRLTLLP